MLLSIELQNELLQADEVAIADERYLVETYRDLAGIQRNLGQLKNAAAPLTTDANLLINLTPANDADIGLARIAAENSLAWIGIHYELQELDVALQEARLADEGHIAVLTSGKEKTTDITSLLLSKSWRGRILDDLKQHDEARAVFATAIDLGRRNLAKNPASRDLQYTVSRLLHWDCRGLLAADRLTDDAVRQMDEAVTMCETLQKDYPLSEGFQKHLGDAFVTAGQIYARMGNPTAAADRFSKGVLLSGAFAKASKQPGCESLLAEILRDQAEFAAATNRKDDAITGLKTALAAVNFAFAEVPESQQLKVLKTDITARLASLSP